MPSATAELSKWQNWNQNPALLTPWPVLLPSGHLVSPKQDVSFQYEEKGDLTQHAAGPAWRSHPRCGSNPQGWLLEGEEGLTWDLSNLT